ncbi:MAG: outer membrane protein assembly factor BamA [Ectothiorhodospiraceae bacterium]|nr:outer membrane protein assembly factor BamA [Ectothiorhodospiraceae bacterium]
MRKLIALLVLALAWSSHAYAFDAFTVEDIRVEGLRRIAPGTVFNYLPVGVNDEMDAQRAAESIRALYRTGFFQDIDLQRDGNVLVVEVVERPSIARVEFFGNDAIDSDPLRDALREVGLAEGETFNRSLLEGVENELRRQYFAQGKYDVEISSTVSPLPRNRVGIRIDIDEGETARIREVSFTGNESFSDRELRRLVSLGPRPWYLPFSRRDQYSRERLSADLEAVRSHYLNRGFVNFNIISTQVSMTPDRRGIYVSVNLSEGERYTIGEVRLVGDLIVGEQELREQLDLERGELFSQSRIQAGGDAIRERLGQEGYAFANVNPIPEVDRETREVTLTYFVDPGARAYVRRINISGNYRTDDEVIRREMRQMEGGWFDASKIRLSRTRLNRLGFFDSVNIETPQVPGEQDQVDVNVNVEEGLSGSLQAGIGYGSGTGVLLNFSVAQDNVLGTGDRVVLAADNNRFSRLYQLTYTDRYYTVDGVTRYFNAQLREIDARRQRLSDYGIRSGSLSVGLGVPLNEEDQIRFDFGVDDIRLDVRDSTTRLQNFVDEFGDDYLNYKVSARWSRNTTDRRIFPTEGGTQQFGGEVTVPGSDLRYYKAYYNNKRYLPITNRVVFGLEGRVAYGEGYGDTTELPFFENFFTGGISSVRGYRASSLGPRDPDDGRPTGGNMRLNASAELQFPVPFVESDAVRLSTFVDGGQVYNTKDDSSVDLGEVRYSAGTAFTWMSPLGALTMSLAWPLNDEPGDDRDRFQFSLGSFF